MRLLAIFILMLLPGNFIWAQPTITPRSYNLFIQGQEQLRQKKFKQAVTLFQKSIQSSPTYLDAYNALGDLYILMGNFDQASETYRRAAGVCTTCANAYALKLTRALCRAQLYNQAEEALNHWQQAGNKNADQVDEYNLLRGQIQFGRYLTNAPHTDAPVNLGSRINSGFDEYFPSISPDDSTLIFTHRTNGMDEDFYKARRDFCGGWFQAHDMGAPPNSIDQEGAQMRSIDGHYLFFMRCGNRSLNGWEGGGCDLYFSYTEPNEWSQPLPFGATINTPAYEGMPSLSADNRVLYFVSDRSGGFGGKDIWFSKFDNGLWQIPENAGAAINTSFDETAPFIAPDNQTLYFTSNGHPGLGGNDIFYSKKDAAGLWQQPENMGYPFNSPYEDVSLVVSANGQKAYFASDRPGGLGGMDLYAVRLPQEAKPSPYTFVYGVVYDSLERNAIPYATIEFYDPETDALLYQLQGNRGDASFMGAIALDKELYLKVFRSGYLSYEDTLCFDNIRATTPDTLNVAMLPYGYSPPLFDTLLTTIYYAPSETALNDSMKQYVHDLLQPYIGKRFMEFIVSGITSASGQPATATELSYERARNITDFLMELGVEGFYIHTQGDASSRMPSVDTAASMLYPGVELILRRP